MAIPPPIPRFLRAVPQVGHSNSINGIAWSPDGRMVASASDDGTLRIWDPGAEALAAVLEGHGTLILGVAWHPGSQEIASAGWDGTVRIWDAVLGRSLRTLPCHQHRILSISWAPDGEHIASAAADRTVKIWHAESGEIVATLEHTDTVQLVAWSPNGRWLASICDHRIQIWNTESWELKIYPEANALRGTGLTHLAWDPQGGRLAAASSQLGYSYSRLSEQDLAEELGTADLGTADLGTADLSTANLGKMDKDFAGFGQDQGVKIWDVETGWCLASLEGEDTGAWALSWDSKGEKIAVSCFETVKLWEVETQRLWGLLEEDPHGIGDLSWEPGGNRIAGSAGTDSVKIWDAPSGQLLIGFNSMHPALSLTAWAPTGRTLATAVRSVVEIRDAASGRLQYSLGGHSDLVKSVAWDPLGERLATASASDPVRIWDTTTGQMLLELEGLLQGIDSLSWAATQARVAASSEEGIRVWDSETGEILMSMEGFDHGGLKISPDGETFAAITELVDICLWDLRTGEPQHRLQGHSDTIRALAWDPSGGRIISAGEDKTARIWDAATGDLLVELDGHAQPVNDLAWDPRGHRVATTSGDMVVRIWDTGSGQLLQTLPAPSEADVHYLAPGQLAVSSVAKTGFIDLWDLETVADEADVLARRLLRIYLARPVAGLVITDDGYIDGPSAAREAVQFADGWDLFSLEEVPERHSPERVQAAMDW